MTSLVQVEGGGFRGEESRFQDYPGVGIVAETGSDVRLTRCTVRGNASSGVWANGARVALEECRLEENFAEGLLIQRGGVVVAERCTFDHNGVRGERGHGVGVLGAGAGTVLRDCVFVHHDLTGVRVVPSRPRGGPITIEGGELTQNGVGLELIGSGRVDLRGVRIHHNLGDGVRAESSAGHLSVGHLEACEVTDNGFGGEGYGVRRDRLSAVELVETRVSGNRSGPSRIVPSLR